MSWVRGGAAGFRRYTHFTHYGFSGARYGTEEVKILMLTTKRRKIMNFEISTDINVDEIDRVLHNRIPSSPA